MLLWKIEWTGIPAGELIWKKNREIENSAIQNNKLLKELSV